MGLVTGKSDFVSFGQDHPKNEPWHMISNNVVF